MENEIEDRQDNGVFSFRGRTGRASFWAIALTIFGISIVLNIVAITLSADGSQTGSAAFLLVTLIVFIPLTWISLATYCRRWHDLDQSGWLTALLFIPLFNCLVFLYLGIAKGTDGPNRFGDDPLAVD